MSIKTFLLPEETTGMMNNAQYPRDRIIVAFFRDTGVRVSELTTLKVDDLDLKIGTAEIAHLKRGVKKKCPVCGRQAGGHTQFCSKCGANLSQIEAFGVEDRGRLISLGPELVEMLKEYTRDMQPEDLLIGLTRQQVNNIVKELAEVIGLKGKCMFNPITRKHHYVHPHDFRAALAVSWLDAAKGDGNMQKALQDHLGHSRFDTTMGYVKLNPSAVRATADIVRQARFGKDKSDDVSVQKAGNRVNDD